MKKHFLFAILLCLLFQLVVAITYGQITELAAGIKKVSLGTIDKFTPYAFCTELPMTTALNNLPACTLPFNITDIKISSNERGIVVEVVVL